MSLPDAKPRLYQDAPFPDALWELVDAASYKLGWRFWLGNTDRDEGTCSGLTLIVYVTGPNSYGTEPGPDTITVSHWFPVPAATYEERTWRRWLFDRCLDVERHEAMEWFKIDGRRPFAPNHGPGRSPYEVHDPSATAADAGTTSGGDVGRFQP